MTHKVVSESVIKSYKDKIASFDRRILEARKFGERGPDCIEPAIRALEELMENAALNKDTYLRDCTEKGTNAARYWQGKEQGIMESTQLFHSPETMIKQWEADKKTYETELKELEQHEQRPG